MEELSLSKINGSISKAPSHRLSYPLAVHYPCVTLQAEGSWPRYAPVGG